MFVQALPSEKQITPKFLAKAVCYQGAYADNLIDTVVLLLIFIDHVAGM